MEKLTYGLWVTRWKCLQWKCLWQRWLQGKKLEPLQWSYWALSFLMLDKVYTIQGQIFFLNNVCIFRGKKSTMADVICCLFFSPFFIFVSCLEDLLPESILDETTERAWPRQTWREPVDSTVREAVSTLRSVALACHRPMHWLSWTRVKQEAGTLGPSLAWCQDASEFWL